MTSKRKQIISYLKDGLTAEETKEKVEDATITYIYKVRSDYVRKTGYTPKIKKYKKHNIRQLHDKGKKPIEIAEELGCSVKYVYKIIKNIKTDKFKPLPKKKYSIIYADPPWKFKSYSDKGLDKSADKHYNCMSIEDIHDLPVENIAATDCILFLWVTFPLLDKGIETIEKWGFTYKTIGFNWVKKNKKSDSLFWGLGFWTRSNSEICLLATKGKPQRFSKSVHSVVISKIEKHSKKPAVVRDKIVELCGDLPRIELFAREKTEGWDAWGNEV